MTKYLPSLLRPNQEANAESLNRPLRRVEEVLSAVSGDNFEDGTFTWENVPLSETMRVVHVFDDTEDLLVPDNDHITCTPYNTTTGNYEGVAGPVLDFSLSWRPLSVRGQDVAAERSFRTGFLHVIFSAQVSSDGNQPTAVQFAIRLDGGVITESVWHGMANSQDPMAGYSQTEFPLMIQAMLPVFTGNHTVEVVYRNVISWQDADERTEAFRVVAYELIIMELGGS